MPSLPARLFNALIRVGMRRRSWGPPHRLVRRARLLGQEVGGFSATYVDPDGIAAELAAARRLVADRGWPVIDVTRRSIEETAAELMNMLGDR